MVLIPALIAHASRSAGVKADTHLAMAFIFVRRSLAAAFCASVGPLIIHPLSGPRTHGA